MIPNYGGTDPQRGVDRTVSHAVKDKSARPWLAGGLAPWVATTPPVVATPDVSVQDFVMDYVMRQGQRAVAVVDEIGRLVGIVSLTDARKLSQQAWPTTRVHQIMTPAPLTTVSATDDVGGAIGLMAQKGLHQLPVVENGRVLGMLNREHVLRWIQLRHHLVPPSREAA